jgi:hypothetical protein
MGCDPEFFFENEQHVVGAEKVLPVGGLSAEKRDTSETNTTTLKGDGKIIIDGVQAELNPIPNTCRANLGNELSRCFQALKKKLEKTNFKVNVTGMVTVPAKEFKELSEDAKRFGCMPDINAYSGKENKITVDATKCKDRTAGGHIHLGIHSTSSVINGISIKSLLKKGGCFSLHDVKDGKEFTPSNVQSKLGVPRGIVQLDSDAKALQDYKTLVKLLDIYLGNLCVLLDTDANNAKRRKIYGKAGDFRLTAYGIEYRTLSNFWLKSYQLFSMVMGISRMCVEMLADAKDGNDQDLQATFDAINEADIVNAINNNDTKLAKMNLIRLLPVIKGMHLSYDYTLSYCHWDKIMYFIDKGIDHWFKHDILEHWANLPEGHGTGFESFINNNVWAEMNKDGFQGMDGDSRFERMYKSFFKEIIQ